MSEIKHLMLQLEVLVQQAFDAGAAAERRRIMAQMGELVGETNNPPGRGRPKSVWTEAMDARLRALRIKGTPLREVALELFGDRGKVGAVSGRIKRLGLPVSEAAYHRGLVSYAAKLERAKAEAA